MLLPTSDQQDYIVKQVGVKPTDGQLPILHDRHRIVQVVGGWRAGKSLLASLKLLSCFWLGKLFWLVGVDYETSRYEFSYLSDFFHKLGLVKAEKFPDRDQCILHIAPDIVIETKSAKYKEKLASAACDGIIMCEAAQMDFDIFQRCQGRLVQNDGWMLLVGTLETSLDWYADKFDEYKMPDNPEGGISYSLPSWSNPHAFPGGRTDPKLKQQEIIMGPDAYSERYGGVPIKPKGLVFPEFKGAHHVGDYRLDPKEPVYVGIDPGYHPSVYAVEVAQFIGDHIYVIDEIYEQHRTDSQIIDLLARKPYYRQIKAAAIDIGSKQHHGEQPTYDNWRKKCPFPIDSRRIQPVADGVNRLRGFLFPNEITGEVRLHIAASCRGLISEFGGCKPPPNIDQAGRGAWKRDMDRLGNVRSDDPQDHNCDAIKALIYAMVSHYGLGVAPTQRSVYHMGDI